MKPVEKKTRKKSRLQKKNRDNRFGFVKDVITTRGPEPESQAWKWLDSLLIHGREKKVTDKRMELTASEGKDGTEEEGFSH